MKKNLLLAAFAFAIVAGIAGASFNTAQSYPDGAPSSVAGAPGDNGKSCAKSGCHPGTATPIFDVITSDVPVTGYMPGETYAITATITDPVLVKYGFEITPQNSTGTILGSMALSDPVNTKFTSSSNKYITHTSNGSNFPGHTATWTFNWTAPVANTGDVTFYGAFDFANNNGGTSGDVIYTSTLTVPEAFGVGISNLAGVSSFNAFPNPATSTISISYYLNQPQSVSIFLYDLTGKMAGQLLNETEAAGTHTPTFALDRFSAGVYMIKLTAGNQSFSRKVIKL